MLAWIEEYQVKRKTLEAEKSVDNYKAMLDICFNLIYNWELVCCLDEFEGLIHFTEETAQRYIFCYMQMEMYCKSGEELEQLDYASVAYTKAKELSIRFPTEKVLEQLKQAKMSMTSFYQLHDLEMLAELVNKQYEQFLIQLRAGTATQKNAEEQVLKWSEAINFAEKYSLQAERNDMKEQPYTSFVIEVLKKLAIEGMQNDLIYMVAALYNLTELTDCCIEDIAEEFGGDIAHLLEEVNQQENRNLLQQLGCYRYRLDTFRENLFVNILLATKICEKELCNSREIFDAAQAEEFKTYINRYHRYNWHSAEKMGRELLELMHAENGNEV